MRQIKISQDTVLPTAFTGRLICRLNLLWNFIRSYRKRFISTRRQLLKRIGKSYMKRHTADSHIVMCLAKHTYMELSYMKKANMDFRLHLPKRHSAISYIQYRL